ncbi:MAG: hypothetical protein NTW03_17265 [Verrucomicrobia bacterium]|nr:hypothetical protein [Verrucomicrobiota bacterium]
MSLLPFDSLTPYRPRRFVPAQIDLGDWTQIVPLLDQLESAAARLGTVAALERWLLDWSELSAALDEESSRRYIAMTCHTESAEAEQAFLHFVEKIEPQLKPRQFKLAEIYLAHPLRSQLPKARYQILDRDTQLHVDLFRTDNVPLETEEARLGQQYQKLAGSLTVMFRGEEKTLAQMGRFQEEPERKLRQETWELVARRRLQERDQFETLFEEMMKVRKQIARNAGCSHYVEFAFRQRSRFDYGPADCRRPSGGGAWSCRLCARGTWPWIPGIVRPCGPLSRWNKWWAARKGFSTGWTVRWLAAFG